MTTSPLGPKFGAARHFITMSHDGEPNSWNVDYIYIQQLFYNNDMKIESLYGHAIRYDYVGVVNEPLGDVTAIETNLCCNMQMNKKSLLM